MKPAPFDYVAPRSLDEALVELSASDGDAKLLAGGQSLIPLLNFRLAYPSRLIDLNRVSGLAYVAQRHGGLAIGAMTRHASIERDPRVKAAQPLLAEAIEWVGHPAIRSRGTIGGSLAHADPAAELPAVAVCLDARFVLASQRGRRTVGAEEFFVGYLSTLLEPDEVLVETWLPPVPSATGQAWLEFSRRHGDYALVGVAVSLTLRDERVERARIVLAGVGGTPVRVREAETLLLGGPVLERVQAAADVVRAAIEPDADLHASKEYRTHLAAVMTERAIRLAHQRVLAQTQSALDVRRTLEGISRRA